jgi:hypothetical protein
LSIRVYQGTRLADGTVRVEKAELNDLGRQIAAARPLDPRLAVLDVEDDAQGFNWGLGDLGPNPGSRRLGFALLSDWLADEAQAFDFLDDYVTLRILMLPDRVWMMRGVDIENDIARIIRARHFGGAGGRA